MILVDTSIWISYFNRSQSGESNALDWYMLNSPDEICLSDIVLTEVLQGIREEKMYKTIKDSLFAFEILSEHKLSIYLKAAEIYRTGRKKGITIRSTIDTIIAAIAVENKLELFSTDRDFSAIAQISPLKLFSA